MYTVGTFVELVSRTDLNKLSVNDLVNLNLDKEQMKLRRRTSRIKVGALGHIEKVVGNITYIRWLDGYESVVVSGIDHMRPVTMPVLIYRPHSNLFMDNWELADWANAVHTMSGAKGKPFTASCMDDRLKGHHCSCGVTADGYTRGTFTLYPLSSSDVRDGCKAYMVCKRCGCTSHL